MLKSKRIRKMSRPIAALLVVVIMATMLCGSALASKATWQNFPSQSVSSYSSYTYAVQAIMYRYNYGTWYRLTDNDYYVGVDGKFGSLTDDAVKYFQGLKGTSQDGLVGPTTWGYLWDSLYRVDTSDSYTYYRVINPYIGDYAISRRYQAVAQGTVVTGWYAYNDYGTACFFAN